MRVAPVPGHKHSRYHRRIVPDGLPPMLGHGGSRWSATCGRCGRASAAMVATSPEHAWTTLQRIGWTLYVDADHPDGQALYRKCASAAKTVDEAVEVLKQRRAEPARKK